MNAVYLGISGVFHPSAEREERLVEVDGCSGLMDPVAQDRLLTLLWRNFGPAKGPLPRGT